MDGLRWLLLLFGLLIVVGVYLYSSRRRGLDTTEQAPDKKNQIRSEPTIEPTIVANGHDDADAVSSASGEHDDAGEQKIVTLRLVARHQGAFAGDELALSLRGIGMRHGKFGIFHRYESDDKNKSIFCAASLVEPGSFDLANLKDQRIPGISLFMVLPGPIDGAQAFDLMIVAARALSQTLNAELLDESGSTLSIQRERYLREEVIQFEHGLTVV